MRDRFFCLFVSCNGPIKRLGSTVQKNISDNFFVQKYVLCMFFVDYPPISLRPAPATLMALSMTMRRFEGRRENAV